MRLVRAAEVHKLLPLQMYGSRRGRMAADALHYAVSWIRDAMRQRQAVTLTVLDIKSAFPSTDPRKLVHILRMRGVPVEYARWIESMLDGRTTTLSFDDFTSDPFTVLSGLDQGCPLSPNSLCLFIPQI